MNSGDGGGWRRVRVQGCSMVPTLCEGDRVIAEMAAAVEVGAVVLVTWESRPGQLSVKRAVRPAGAAWWVRGDNAAASTDSRSLGPATVLGVLRWRWWPRPGRIR
ncbi:MAG: S26 family signal peptidase [Sciscionella sp.]